MLVRYDSEKTFTPNLDPPSKNVTLTTHVYILIYFHRALLRL